MSKAKIIDKKSVDSILGEKSLLSELHHPFIVNMVYSFQDHDYLYLVMDLLPGGNLRYHLGVKKHFNEKQIKFLIGCLMIGLQYIHGQNILHRDIKPENLVFDNNGYLRITDFGIAKHYVFNNKKDTSGTIGYLAPEVLCNVNHNFSIDYYAVGIITYELMYGHRPYLGKNKHEVKQLILTRQAEIDYDDLPDNFSNEIADFINQLIQRKPKNRLGKDNINQVIEHPWLLGFDWENAKKKILKAPYIPKLGDNFDKNYCLQNNKIGADTIDRYQKIMNDDNYNIIFQEFNCNKIPEELKGYNTKKMNEGLYSANNVTSNTSTTSMSRNNRNDKQNIILGHKNIINKSKMTKKDSEDNNDFEKEIFQQISTLNKSLQKLVVNKNNSINVNSINIIKNNNIGNYKNKTKYDDYYIYNKSTNTIFRNKDNNLNQNININKTYKNDHINKNILNENINHNNNLNISNINKPHIYNYSINQKNQFEGIDNDNIIFNDKNLIEHLFNKKNDHVNRNSSMHNLNVSNKSKYLVNSSTVEDQNSLLSFNSGILKNMKYQYQELYPNKRSKFLNYSVKDISKNHKSSNISHNNIYNNNNNNHNNNNNSIYNINNNNNSVYYNKINNNILQSNNNSISKKNTNISTQRAKKDYIRRELLKNATIYQNNHSNLNLNLNKKVSPLLMSSTIYSKKKTNSAGHSVNSKRLSSSHSMRNLKSKIDIIRKDGNNNNSINKQKTNFMDSDRCLKNISILEKKLPFINISLNKKKDLVKGSDLYYVSFGKFNNGNDRDKDKYKYNNDNILNNDYFTDRIRNKKLKNNGGKINFNNKSVNNFLDYYK